MQVADVQYPEAAALPVRTAPVAASLPAWEDDVAAAEASFTSAPIVVPTAAPSSDKAQDILAMIRARQNKS